MSKQSTPSTPISPSQNEQFDPFWRHRSASVVRYVLAITSVGVMLTLTGWLREWYHGTPNALFFCAIIFSGWFGGLGPGLVSTALSILAIKFYFTPPSHSFALALDEIPRFAVFLVAGGFISWLGDRQRRDEAALMRARNELDEKVRARTADLSTANEHLTREIAERTRAESELQRSNRALRVRTACNQAVNRCNDEPTLLEEVCDAVVKVAGYRLAWVGYAENGGEKAIRVVARAGDAQHYLDHIAITWGDDDERGRGPTGMAIRAAQPVVCNHLDTDPRLAPWRRQIAEYGLKSLVALPLTVDGRAMGALMVYSDEPVAFDDKETDLLEQAAVDLTHGVILLRTRAARQRAEEALEKTEAELSRVARVTAMGELAASIAHEVNQPLTSVVTNGNAAFRWLAADPPNFDEVRDAIQRIVRDGSRAGDVIARIRTLLRKEEPVAQLLDLNDTIREIVALTQTESSRRGVSLQMDLSPDLPAVTGDRVQLQQVLLNLIINAFDAVSAVTDRPRLVWVRTRAAEPRSILVAVEDSGAGIDPEHAARLFDAFYTTKPEGLGMGLSISRSIIEALGGRLWATPNPGPGTTFQFTLPTEKGAEA